MTNDQQLRADLMQLPVAEVLSRYNALATDAQRPALKSWKGPREQLVNRFLDMKRDAQKAFDAKIAAEEAKVTVVPTAVAKGADQPQTRAAQRKVRKLPKKHRLPEPPAPKAVKELLKVSKAKKTSTPRKSAPAGDTFTLADLARDSGVNPKVMRAKARRHEKDLSKLRVGADGWTFKNSDRAAVAKVLGA